MSKKIKALIFVCCMSMLMSICFGIAPTFATEYGKDILVNGAIETPDAIDPTYGILHAWYHNAGGIDAEYVTSPVHGENSTGALLHHGEKELFHRFIQGFDQIDGISYVFKGYVRTEAEGVALDVELINMMGVPPYAEDHYAAGKFELTKGEWTEISVKFRFDSKYERLFIGEVDTKENGEKNDCEASVKADHDIINIGFKQTQETKADVVYDDFTCVAIDEVPVVPESDNDWLPGTPVIREKEIMVNGAIESEDVINRDWGDMNKWYHNGGQIDADFVTDRVYGENSKGALLHHGAKNLFYRCMQDYNRMVNTNYRLTGYVYTDASDVSLDIIIDNQRGVAPWDAKDYKIATVALKAGQWTEISVLFRMDTAAGKVIVGAADTAENGETNDVVAEFDPQMDIMNLLFVQSQEAKSDVVYDQFSCKAEKAHPADYDGQYDHFKKFIKIPGNLIEDSDMAKAPAAPSAGKWGSYQSQDYGKTEEQFLTGNSSYRFRGAGADGDFGDFRYGLSWGNALTKGDELSISVFAKKEATDKPLNVSMVLAVSAYKVDGAFNYAFIELDQCELSSSTWRELKGFTTILHDPKAMTVTYTENGGEAKVVEDMKEIISAELLLKVDNDVEMYVDSAYSFVKHQSKIKFISGETGKPVAGLDLVVKDAFNYDSNVAYSYDEATGYYVFEEADRPLVVTTTVDGQEVKKSLFFGNSDVVVVAPYEAQVTLKDVNGEVISGADVTIKAQDGSEMTMVEKKDAPGVYVTETPLSDTAYTVSVYKDGYVFDEAELSYENKAIEMVGAEDKPITFRVEVSIFDKEFKAVTGATVELLENGEVIYTLKEVGDGVYALDGIEGFEFEVKVTKEGWTFDEGKLDANNRTLTLSGQKDGGAENPEKPDDNKDESEKKGGCGSMVAGSALTLAAAALIGSTVMLKKRNNKK